MEDLKKQILLVRLIERIKPRGNKLIQTMDSNKYVGIVVAIAVIVFSLLILAIFFYRVYLMAYKNEDRSADEVENDTIK